MNEIVFSGSASEVVPVTGVTANFRGCREWPPPPFGKAIAGAKLAGGQQVPVSVPLNRLPPVRLMRRL